MTRLVLLPGLDGTGLLFKPLLRALPAHICTQVVAYPGDCHLSYPALAQWVLGRLPPDEPYVLLGESFSGPVAVLVAAQRPPQALVLACSFICSPLPWLRPIRHVLNWLPSPLAWLRYWSWALVGAKAPAEVTNALRAALATVSPQVLLQRAAAISTVDVTQDFAALSCPVLYVQAARDRLVPPSCADEVLRLHPGTAVKRIDGPHGLLQVRPERCAEVIASFMDTCGAIPAP
jgi:pimeloyl-ACP methyl ester carboxylesterase